MLGRSGEGFALEGGMEEWEEVGEGLARASLRACFKALAEVYRRNKESHTKNALSLQCERYGLLLNRRRRGILVSIDGL